MAHEAIPIQQPMPVVLWALLFGNFVIVTGVMAVLGTLNELSTSLQVPIATAGQLISVGALLICLGAPLFASLVGGWDRRRLLALTMLWCAVLLMVCGAMPTFSGLFFVRVLAMVSPAVFTPQAAAYVGLLVAADQCGRAITMVFLGWSVASVLGMPIAAWIGGTLGWRSTFIAIGVLERHQTFSVHVTRLDTCFRLKSVDAVHRRHSGVFGKSVCAVCLLRTLL